MIKKKDRLAGWEVISDPEAFAQEGDILAWFKADPSVLDLTLEISCINGSCVVNCGGMRFRKVVWSMARLGFVRNIIAMRHHTRKRLVLFRKIKVYIPRRLPLNPHFSKPLPLP